MARRAKLLLLVPLGMDLVVLLFLAVAEGPPLLPAGLEFTLPVALPSLFQVRGAEGGHPFGPLYELPEVGQSSLALLLLLLVLQSFLGAGYVGRLELLRRREVGPDFAQLGGYAFARFLAYHAVVGFLLLAAAPFLQGEVGTAADGLFVLAVVLAILYALFLTPFAIVVDDVSLSAALRLSVELSFRQARHVAPYVVAYIALTFLLSATLGLLAPLGILALPLAAAAVAGVGTALVASTLALYAALTPREPLPVRVPQPVPAEDAASA